MTCILREVAAGRKNLYISIFLAAVFGIVDYIFLKSLPDWKISFNPVTITFLLFAFTRCGLWVIYRVIRWRANQNSPDLYRFPIWILLVLNLMVSGLGFYGLYVEPSQVTTTYIEINAPGLSRPIRIVQLSDLHIVRTSRREELLPGIIAEVDPDMIVMTGDYINKAHRNDQYTQIDLKQLLNQLHAPLGVYAVNGNVESPGWMEHVFSGTGVTVLDNQVAEIAELGGNFTIIGLSDAYWPTVEKNFLNTMDQVDPGGFTLLLTHAPEIVYSAAEMEIDLYLAGHTHGGQVRAPLIGALFTNSRYGKRFEMGLYKVKDMHLFVSRGLGFAGGKAPQLRFLALPEVVVIDLLP